MKWQNAGLILLLAAAIIGGKAMLANAVVSCGGFSKQSCLPIVTFPRAVALFLLLLPSFGLAQTFTTSLRGTVVDSSGAVVPGATISLDSKSTGSHLTTHTDAKGDYQFQ